MPIGPPSVDCVAAGDPKWDEARRAFNLAIDQRPELIAYPESATDVITIVDFARDNGLRIAPQRTGHAAEPIESLAGVLLLRTDRLRDIAPLVADGAAPGSPDAAAVSIDPAARTARVAAGVLWGEVADLAAPHGLAPLAGSSRTVGVAGYSLGGGLSLVSRKLGLGANAVRAIELVTATGERVRVSDDGEPELFWALRGGGGNFGIVTALEINLFATPEVYAGNLIYPAERAAEVFHAWREATLTAPDELTLSARILRVPDMPAAPPALRGRTLAVADVVFLGGEADGAEPLVALRALGPEIDTVAAAAPDILGRVHMDPEVPSPSMTDYRLTRPLPPEAIDAFLAAAGPDSGSTLNATELRQTGGALSRPAPGGGALASLPGDYLTFGAGTRTPGADAALRADLDRLLAALAPYDAGRFVNFSERPAPISAFFTPDVVDRLRAVKQHWDPDDLLVAGHPID